MGRHKKSIERPCMPDVKYNSKVVTKFVSRMMLDGKKSICTKIVYEAMDNLKAKTDKDPLEVLLKALENVKPMVEVKSRRVGGANYQIPFPIAGHRQMHFAFTWLVQSARARSGMPYAKRLEAESVDAYNETGAAFKKKEDCHRMAEANRAFAHFARA